MNPQEAESIAQVISAHLRRSYTITEARSLGGGCINRAYRVSNGSCPFFVKANQSRFLDCFRAEAQALTEIAATQSIRVPEVIEAFEYQGNSYLVLEYLDLGYRNGDWEAMGQQLALLHRPTQRCFGWSRDNWIGSTPQSNTHNENWSSFFIEQRLSRLIDLCRSRGFSLTQADQTISAAETLLSKHACQPSLLHGDLWSGNASFDRNGQPVLFDPASYWGDRETDIAFTHFFGGFAPAFYQAYQETFPLPDGYAERFDLYNLYHCLNHVSLFGESYASQANALARRVISYAA